ncbi:hypothetical protein HZ326_26156 [Fusarium oxysporum f. sp. albedinis]|nr:Uncharacterized protein HZ326_29046 [Fusarium oxysporum f. sp. albedinis]KAJ0130742.1 hypothetical protein HZ326_26156 [Fusarium oxysporum f. sp. albedinis]
MRVLLCLNPEDKGDSQFFNTPINESVFYHMEPGNPDVADSEWEPGLWAYMIKLVEIYHRPSLADRNKYAHYCQTYVTIICDMLKASREVLGAKALYNIMGHVTIVSPSVLLHIYLFGKPHELEDSRNRLG